MKSINQDLIVFMPLIEKGGGVEKNFFIITNYLSERYKRIKVISLSEIPKYKFNKNIKVVGSKNNFFSFFGRRTKFLISLIYLLKEILVSNKPKILCFQGIVYCVILSKILGLKIIVRSNSSPSGWSKNIIKKIFYKTIYRLADKIIVNSLDFKRELKDKFNLNSISIYNPLNLNEILKYSKKKIVINFFKKKSLNIISVARLAEQKDHICLIKSINLLKNKYNIKLLLLGSGPKKREINNLIEKFNLNKNIKILDFKKNPYPYIKKSDLFILSSRFEGSPNVLLEALALKKFVISSDCPTGPKEILDNGKGGILFKPGDYKMLSNKIIFYIKNKKRLEKKKIYAFKRLSRFNYKDRLKEYYDALNF
tara:strand:- start:261 stop:1361 length:1101 start_codon:yes stop_codon:yes gene_type:complete